GEAHDSMIAGVMGISAMMGPLRTDEDAGNQNIDRERQYQNSPQPTPGLIRRPGHRAYVRLIGHIISSPTKKVSSSSAGNPVSVSSKLLISVTCSVGDRSRPLLPTMMPVTRQAAINVAACQS